MDILTTRSENKCANLTNCQTREFIITCIQEAHAFKYVQNILVAIEKFLHENCRCK